MSTHCAGIHDVIVTAGKLTPLVYFTPLVYSNEGAENATTALMLELFESVAEKDKTAAIHNIIENASPKRDFFLMVILGVAVSSETNCC